MTAVAATAVRRDEASAGHRHLLYRHGDTLVHRLPPEAKIVSAVAFTFVVVATPAEQRWAFAAYAVLLGVVCGVARLSPGFVVPRTVVELPFVIFALLIPFIAAGPRTELLGLTVSEPGLELAFGILAKGTLGVVASIILAATTDLRAILAGLHRLHVPPLLVQIMAFMLRYLEVVGAEAERMRIARTARCFEARRSGRLGVMAAAAGSIFIRSYERGERVHLAMLSRGYAGAMPVLGRTAAAPYGWLWAMALPIAGTVVLVTAWIMQ